MTHLLKVLKLCCIKAGQEIFSTLKSQNNSLRRQNEIKRNESK